MDCLEFIFFCNNKQQFLLAEQVFLLGHKVKVINHDLSLQDCGENLGISTFSNLQEVIVREQEIIVSFNEFKHQRPNRCFMLNSSINLENIASLGNQLFSINWCYFINVELEYSSHYRIAKPSNLDSMIEELYEEFIEYVLSLSRYGYVINNSINANNIFRSYLDLGFNETKSLLESIYSLLHSYKKLSSDQIPIASNCYFPPAEYITCDIKWVAQESLLCASDRIRIILPKDNITVEINQATISAYIDLDLRNKGIAYKTYDKEYSKILDHLFNILPIKTCYLTPEEQQTILYDFNDTNKIFNVKQTIDQQFDHIASLYPQNTAIVDQYGEISYQKLNKLSIHLSKFLLRTFDHSNISKIAIALPKTRYLIAAIFGILRIKGCYIPIDQSYPIRRIKSILNQTSADVVICDQVFFDTNYELLKSFKIILIEHIFRTRLEEVIITSNSAPNDLAYIIFTSGSTGEPKGVMIEHCSVVNLSQTASEFCNISINSKLLSVASIGFDALGWDIYGALLNGATVCLAMDDIQKYPDQLTQYIKNNQITIATLTPPILSLLSETEIPSLRTMVVMGDRSNKKLMESWSKNLLLINGYGPTEATIGATLCKYDENTSELCIGKPMHNYQVYILDQNLRPVPINIPGELCIAGIGLARGYLNNEILNTEKFIYLHLPHQNSQIRMYRTGDLAKWNEQGMIEFVGRIDRQVKIRGVRIEIGEVEAKINEHPMIKESLVVLWGEEINKKLVAYIILKQNIKQNINEITRDLRKFLATFVHPAALPDAFTIIPSYPININGKIDLKALPAPTFLSVQDIIEPRFYEEDVIKKIFIEILGNPNIGIFESFLELGGHSLSATQIGARINQIFASNLSTKDIFENSTIASLASLVLTQKSSAKNTTLLSSFDRQGALTSSQERLWYLYQLDPTNTSYNLPLAIKLIGPLNYTILSQSLTYIIERHETFRTIFYSVKAEVYQKVLPKKKINIKPKLIHYMSLHNDMTQLCQKPFVLEKSPPVRITLYKISDVDHVLLFVKHNIITDAWSEGLIIKELFQIYQQLQSKGIYPILPKLQHQIIDVANYHKSNKANSSERTNALNFWKNSFYGYKEFEFPSEYQRPEIMSYTGKRIFYIFDNCSWKALSNFAKSQNVTIFMVILSVLKILIYKYTSVSDIAIGTAIAGRNKQYLENVTGFFVNTLPIRTKFLSSFTFKQFLQDIKEGCLEVYKYQDTEFEQIVDVVKPIRHLNKNPLFQIMLVLQNADEELLPVVENLEISKINVDTKTTMFDMVWNFQELNGYLCLNLDFSTELYKEETIWRIIKNYEVILSEILVNTNQAIANIKSIATEEMNFISSNTQGKITEIKNFTIGEWLNHSCNINNKNIAIQTSETAVSYKQLNDISTNIANYLISTIGDYDNPEIKRIGILLNRSHNLIIAIYGVLKAGYCYVPLDPDYPEERLKYMVTDAKLHVIIYDANLLELAQSISSQSTPLLININSIKSNIIKLSNHSYQYRCNNLAYILYTSGSTGLPKGVMITHTNLVNFCHDMIERLKFRATDIFMSITTISFDIFGLEYLCTLLVGAKLFVCSQDIARNPVSLVNLFNELQPTKMQATPTMWSMIIDHIAPIKNFMALCGGEKLSQTLLNKLQNKHIIIWNLYGPTETTIWSTGADLSIEKYVHIGYPIYNTKCYVLDDDLSITPIGVYGRLFISGLGVSKGYWYQNTLTAQQFVSFDNKITYNTGDLAKLNDEGKLILAGRTDLQIKIRGNRIELGDIEYHLALHSKIKEVICHVITHDMNDFIAAYIIPTSFDDVPNDEELRSFLEKKIQAVAMPSAFIMLKAFPLTHNKKVDRRKLPHPKHTNAYSEVHYVAPTNESEIIMQKIWSEILKIQKISIKEDFFYLGGNSLHIPQIVSAINAHFKVNLTIRDFILNASISSLVSFIKNMNNQIQGINEIKYK